MEEAAKKQHDEYHVNAAKSSTQQQHEDFSINAVRKSTYRKYVQQNKNSSSLPYNKDGLCTGCGKPGHNDYLARKANCPAWGKICNNCN